MLEKPRDAAKIGVSGVLEDLVAEVVTDGKADQSAGAHCSKEPVSGFVEVDAPKPLFIAADLRVECDVVGKEEIDADLPVLVFQDTVEGVATPVPSRWPPTDEPRFRPPSVRDVAVRAALVGAPDETHIGLEVRRQRIRADPVSQVTSSLPPGRIDQAPGNATRHG